MVLRDAVLHHGLKHDRDHAVGLHRDVQRDLVQEVALVFIPSSSPGWRRPVTMKPR